jgi:Mrp family chromosome partitioning ATPase
MSPFQRLHLMLQGRYHWAALLALIGGMAGGLAGYQLWSPRYEAEGLIQLQPYMSPILYETEETGIMPMFEAFVSAQTQLLRSREVMRAALQGDAWQQVAPNDADGSSVDQFKSDLTIEKRDQFVEVRYTAKTPERAKAAVTGLIGAYMQTHGRQSDRSDQQRLEVLKERQANLENKIDNDRKTIRRIADEFGSKALQQNYQYKLDEMHKLESELREVELALARAGARVRARQANQGQSGKDNGGSEGRLTAMQIAQRSPRMDALLQEQQQITTRIEELEKRLGRNHHQVKNARIREQAIEKLIDAQVTRYNAQGGGLMSQGQDGADQMQNLSIPELRARRQRLQELYHQAKQRTIELGRKRLEIESLEEQTTEAKEKLQRIRERIDQVKLESIGRGRVKVVDRGQTPSAPANAHRKIQYTAAGLVGGGGAGVGLLLLLGLFDRRLRSTQEASLSLNDIGLLGVLPELPRRLDDAQGSALAAHAVHHIRSLLQLGGSRNGAQVYAISSAMAGSGKTSLTLALGMSFANAGSRTLIIDADLASGGLTRRLGATIRKPLGELLIEADALQEDDLQRALAHAQAQQLRLGEALVALNLVDADTLDEALNQQEASMIGVLDAMRGASLGQCITNTPTEHLAILPVGSAEMDDVRQLAPEALHQVIDAARSMFDTILIDTGPAPDSVESSIAAAAADGVVLTVSRGDDRPQVVQAIHFLRSVGATMAGFVFNRAAPADRSMLSSYSAQTSRVSGRARPRRRSSARRNGRGARPQRVDPVTGALVGRPRPQLTASTNH